MRIDAAPASIGIATAGACCTVRAWSLPVARWWPSELLEQAANANVTQNRMRLNALKCDDSLVAPGVALGFRWHRLPSTSAIRSPR
jgi:hypothetical protein